MWKRVYPIIKYKIVLPVLALRKAFYTWIDRHYDDANIMVNVGSGYFFERHWKALDYSSPAYPYHEGTLDYNFDLMGEDPFPFDDNSVKFFYSSHTLEHIPPAYCPRILAEMCRCLKPGGAVRLTMPDYDFFYDAYLDGRNQVFTEFGPGYDNMEMGLVSVFAWAAAREVPREKIRKDVSTMSREEFADHYVGLLKETTDGRHKNWWNFDKLHRMLGEAGFTTIVRSEPRGSRFPEMRGHGSFFGLTKLFPENRMLGFDNAHPESSVFVEAVK